MTEPIVIAGFPITDAMSLRHYDTHFDVPFEVSNHGRDQSEMLRGSQGTWCYYVTISEQMVDEEAFAKFWLEPKGRHIRGGREVPHYDYMSAPFSNVHWHGGVTYYEKLGGLDGDVRRVKIGCDFAHFWDEGHAYEYADVEREARQTIDELRSSYAFRRRCTWSGQWLPEDELTKDGNGRLVSKARAAELAATAG